MTGIYDFEDKFIYIVVADSRKAKVFVKNIGTESNLVLVSEIFAMHFQALYKNIDDIARSNFAEQVSQIMNKMHFCDSDNIVLIAPGKIMDFINHNLESHVVKRLIARLNEDMVWMEPRDINRYIAPVVNGLNILDKIKKAV